MKIFAVALGAFFASTSAYANLQADMAIPSEPPAESRESDTDEDSIPVVRHLADGRRCVWTSFGQQSILELIEDEQPIAAETFFGSDPISAFNQSLLESACGKGKNPK
jgi:hypothetical protein